MTTKRWLIITGMVLTLGIWVALAAMAQHSYPIHEGTASTFWDIAVQFSVSPNGFATQSGYTGVHRGRCIYAYYGCYAPVYHDVSSNDALREFVRVKPELQRRAVAGDPNDFVATAYARWDAMGPAYQQDLGEFFAQIRKAQIAQWGTAVEPYPLSYTSKYFADQDAPVTKADYYWLNFLFEGLFLMGLVWLVLWPWLCHRGIIMRLILVALLSPLFYLPTWLGYGIEPVTRDDAGGVIIYRYLVEGAGHPLAFNDWELDLLYKVPHVLTPLQQGARNSHYFGGHYSQDLGIRGPVDVLLRSAILTAVVGGLYGCVLLRRRVAMRRARGFPVLIEPPRKPE